MASASEIKSPYDPKVVDPRRYEINYCLGEIYLTMKNGYEDTYLDEETLAKLNIDVNHMSLNTGNSDVIRHPFFMPLDQKVVDEHWPENEHRVADEWPDLNYFSKDNFNAAAFANHFADYFAYYTFLNYNTWDWRRYSFTYLSLLL